MKIDYVTHKRVKGRDYYYFRYGADGAGKGDKYVRLDGAPGSHEFQKSYAAALAEYGPAPAARLAPGSPFPVGSLGWVIAEYKRKAPQWREAADSTREIYDRRFEWLTGAYGERQMGAFDQDMLYDLRDLPEFADKPSVADMTVERFAHLWDFARQQLRHDMKLSGLNPGRGVAKAHRSEGESAPLWPLELCRKFEALANGDLVTFYFLARYTGQRRSDLANMQWDHIAGDEMFVAQVKTGARIWVPMPTRLRDYLADWPRTGPYIVMSPKGRGKPTPWRETSITNQFIKATRALGFKTVDSKGEPRFYSPHGLRHLCGVELAHAGASDRQIAAVLGHATLKQVEVYVKQAQQRVLARDAQKKRDAMYERELLDAAIDAADNVARLRAGGNKK
jgi:integrase